MPYPLAHPVAVLPLRRYCPQRLDFPSLVIGSLIPDLGYAFEHSRGALFSHSFAGSFGFCLPAGLVIAACFYLLGRRAVRVLPEPYRTALLPLCQRSVRSVGVVVISLLIGAWSHLLLDSLTHEDGWFVQRLAFLRCPLPWPTGRNVGVYASLYAGCTFGGVLWLALSYLRWLDGLPGHPAPRTSLTRRIWSVALAAGTLGLAETSRGPWQLIGAVPAVCMAALLVAVFLVGTAIRMKTAEG